MASAIFKSLTSKVDELKEPPKKVNCLNPACKKELDVPPGVFDWACSNPVCRKINERSVSACTACQSQRVEVIAPSVRCAACGCSTEVPSSNASKHLKATGAAAKKFAQDTAQKTKETYEMLKSRPTQFNCQHCNALLGVPPGLPWNCPRVECGFLNQDGLSDACLQCKITREMPELKVECGVCHKVTSVPTTNFVNKVKSGVQDLDRSVKKIYYDLSGTDYVVCPRCAAPIKLVSAESKVQTPGPAVTGQVQSVAAPASCQSVDMNNVLPVGKDVVCVKCQEKLVLVKK